MKPRTALVTCLGAGLQLVMVSTTYAWLPSYFNRLYGLSTEAAGLKMPQPPQNILSPADVRSLAGLAEFEPIKSESRLLLPFRLLGLGRLVNRFLAPLPLLDKLCLRHYTVCRSLRHAIPVAKSSTVVVPARNERGIRAVLCESDRRREAGGTAAHNGDVIYDGTIGHHGPQLAPACSNFKPAEGARAAESRNPACTHEDYFWLVERI